METISNLCRLSKVGKLLPDSLYVHLSAISLLHPKLQSIINLAWSLAFENEAATLVKVSKVSSCVSFLYYDDFDTDPHPPLLKSICVDYDTSKVKVMDFSKRSNRPILHRKETMVDKSYPLYNEFCSITIAEEAKGYYKDTRRIGTEKGWADTIKNNRRKQMSNVKCPVCGGELIYHRVDDGESKVIIRKEEDGHLSAEEIGSDSNGSTRVYCNTDESHDIPVELWDEVVLIAEDFGY